MGLGAVPDPHSIFDLAELNTAVAATPFAGHIHHLHTAPSTNDLALKAAQSGARIGVWVADRQIAGRGRGSNTWHSPAGAGLYMTALIAPPIAMQSALALSLRVAVAVQLAIVQTTGFTRPDQIDIRWPNDLMLAQKDGPARKCGGILIDTASNPARYGQLATLRYAIIGIGINLNQTSFPPELDAIATSLLRELPPSTDRLSSESFTRSVENSTKCRSVENGTKCLPREPLVAAILLSLDAEINSLTSNLEPRTSNLSQCSTWITGKRVRIEPRDGVPGYTGTTAGLNPQGFLLVAGDDGQIHTVLSGGLREP
jgi:BirA family transcriptional regulator, biotin operon repressor / biotin---[acetyl-CoA-carboxylase] ligase